MVDSGDVFQPQAWTPAEAYRFLQDIPLFEQSGLLVRVPDWWKANRPPRPIVKVTLGERGGATLGVDAMLDFSVAVALEGERLSPQELQTLLNASGELVWLKGRWVEIDRDKLREALQHWKSVEHEAKHGGLSFFEGMRLLSGVSLSGDEAAASATTAEWTGIAAGQALEETLAELRATEQADGAQPSGLQAELRPYQRQGVGWLRYLTRLGLGACLADDMGLGKTVQVIALVLDMKHRRPRRSTQASSSLLVLPASLVANWKAELARFAPSLSTLVVHPSESRAGAKPTTDSDAIDAASQCDLVLTTSTPDVARWLDWLRQQSWQLVVLDEAQTIKNPGTRQARAAKQLRSAARVALTGTPIENRLGDLWSLFDFLNPGLLGSAKEFASLVKRLASREHDRFGPLRRLIQPYLLRRLKTDKQVIADLPDKVNDECLCGAWQATGRAVRTCGVRPRPCARPASEAEFVPPRHRAIVADAAEADLQSSGPGAGRRGILSGAKRKIPAPGRDLRRTGRTAGKGWSFCF